MACFLWDPTLAELLAPLPLAFPPLPLSAAALTAFSTFFTLLLCSLCRSCCMFCSSNSSKDFREFSLAAGICCWSCFCWSSKAGRLLVTGPVRGKGCEAVALEAGFSPGSKSWMFAPLAPLAKILSPTSEKRPRIFQITSSATAAEPEVPVGCTCAWVASLLSLDA